MNNSERNSHLLFAALLALLLALPILGLLADPAQGEPRQNEAGSDVQDSWKAGLIGGAFLFNNHLNDYRIETRVSGTTAYLTGTVSSEAKRALAEEIALSIEGIDDVENYLTVDPHSPEAPVHVAAGHNFSDAAVTTKVKSQLLANSETSGLDIEVKTTDHVVVLTGEVPSDVEKELAYYVTRNTGGVRHVVNKIAVKPRA